MELMRIATRSAIPHAEPKQANEAVPNLLREGVCKHGQSMADLRTSCQELKQDSDS
jgi:hypothetical protein